MKQSITIIDVAKKAGVAKSTVSNVLTGKRFVSETLKNKVLKACEELNFHPNFYAAGLSSHKSKIIALFLESNNEVGKVFYQRLIISCLKQASKRGYSLLLYYNSDSNALINTLRIGVAPIDGAILMTPCVEDERLKEIERERIDCVVIGRPDDALNLDYIDVDNKKLVADVCSKLLELYGRDIYLINSDINMTISQDRANTFRTVCEQVGIDYVSHHIESKKSNQQDGYDFSKSVMKAGSAFITANEHLAAGVYAAAEANGLKIGKDVGVFSLGRSMKHGVFKPSLSYAEQDYKIIGKRVTDMLIDKIEGEGGKKCVLLESSAIFTSSTDRRSE